MADEKEESPPKIGGPAAMWQDALTHSGLGKTIKRLEGMRPAIPLGFNTQIGAVADALRPVNELNKRFSLLPRVALPDPGSLAAMARLAEVGSGIARLARPVEAAGSLMGKFRQAEDALARLAEDEQSLVWDFIAEGDAGEAFGWVLECARLAGDDIDAFRCITVTAARFGQSNIEGLATKSGGSSVAEIRQAVGEHERLSKARRAGAEKVNKPNENAKTFVLDEASALLDAYEAGKERPPQMGEFCNLLHRKLEAQHEEIEAAVVTVETIKKWLKDAEKAGKLVIPAAVSRRGRPKK